MFIFILCGLFIVLRFLYNYFGINLYDDKTTLIYDEQELNEYKISYYSKIINGESYPTRLYPLEIKRQRNKLELMNYTRSYTIPNLILIFFSFSFVGWLWEVMLHIVSSGKFVNRGVLHGPWLPIYGSGAILIMLLLKKFRTKPALEFSSMILVCGLVEYFTAVYLETKFGIRWWNYDGYFLNIQGRVCAEGLLVFGKVFSSCSGTDVLQCASGKFPLSFIWRSGSAGQDTG